MAKTRPIFRPAFGNRPDRIVGRDDVLGHLDDSLASYPGSRGRATLIMGQRGMGKTALLLEIADRARDAGYVVARVTCGDTMLDAVLDILQRDGGQCVKDKKPPVKGFSAGALGFSFGLTFTEEVARSYGFRVKLEMLCDRLAEADKGVLILVDEVEPSCPALVELATTYQELVGEEKNVAVFMAGLPAALSEVLNERTLTFLNRADKIDLGPISIASVRAYYASAFSRAGRVVSDDILDKAARATSGFPYLLQLIGYFLVEYSSEYSSDGEVITDQVLDRACRAAFDEFDSEVIRATLRPLSPGDVEFQRAMAVDDGPTRVADLQTRLGVSQGHVQSYRRRLLDACVVTAPRRGELDFVIPQLRGHLRGEERREKS